MNISSNADNSELYASNSALFSSFFARYGGPFNTAEQPNMKRLLDRHLQRVRDKAALMKKCIYPQMLDVHFDYVKNEGINAFAAETQDQKRGFIGITVGTTYLLFWVFRRMLADCRVMPETGAVEQESGDLPSFSREPVKISNIYADLSAQAEPKSLFRMLVAASFIEIGFDFLAAHEYGHIALGHTFYYRELKRNPIISEFAWDEPHGIDVLCAQTMELDADFVATNHGLADLLRRLEKPQDVPEYSRDLYFNAEEALYRWFFAVLTSFRLFGDRRFDLDKLDAYDHPYYRIRQRQVCEFGEIFLNEHCPKLGKTAMDIAMKALGDVETAYAQITATDTEFPVMRDVFCDLRVNEHLKKLSARSREMEAGIVGATGNRLMIKSYPEPNPEAPI